MPLVNLNLSIVYHNIDGLHHSTLGCKLTHCIELLNDIEILAETWSECSNCRLTTIQNYELVKTIAPLKQNKKGRKSGGIHIFSKSVLKPCIKIIKTSDHYIWLEIDKNIFENLNKNLVICAIYSQPSTSKYYKDEIWDDLETDILNLTSDDTPYFIIGDMNGKVGEVSEFIEPS